MNARYVFPAVVEWLEEDNVYDIVFPDLEECFTFAENEEDIFRSARDVLELCIYEREEEDKDIPKSSKLNEIKLSDDQFIIMVDVWMLPVRDRFRNKAVKKTLTIPKWLNDMAEESNINFSQVLQSSIKEYLGIKQ